MPAITLGLAEVEERLQALCQRLNYRTAQHGIYVASATAVLLGTVLIPVGLRASPATFRVVAWASALLLLTAVLACITYAWWHWSDIRSVARLVDERAQLTDRLATLVDLQRRQRTSRLAPLLVAQTLALGARWQPQRIIPRPVPRSVFLLLAALLALAATTAVERQTRWRAGSAAAHRPQPAAQDTAAAPQTASAQATRASASGEPAGMHPSRDTNGAGSLPGSGSDSTAALASRSDTTTHSGQLRDGAASLTDRLQHAIADTFRADKPEAREQRRGQGGSTSDANAPAQAGDEPQRHNDTASRSAAEHGRGVDKGKTGTASASGQNTTQGAGGANVPQNFAGESPDAGKGSSPEGWMQATAPGRTANASAPKPFTLTITSVPRAREARGTPGNQAATGPGLPSLAAANGESAPALSEHQLGDDALRKAEIPAEYEDVIRGVFTSRAGR